MVAFCAIGVFSLNGSTFDLFLMPIFALFGYILVKHGCVPAPLLLGYIIGPMMEEYLRRALLLARGDAKVFVTRPLNTVMLGLALVTLFFMLLPAIQRKRDEALEEDV